MVIRTPGGSSGTHAQWGGSAMQATTAEKADHHVGEDCFSDRWHLLPREPIIGLLSVHVYAEYVPVVTSKRERFRPR